MEPIVKEEEIVIDVGGSSSDSNSGGHGQGDDSRSKGKKPRVFDEDDDDEEEEEVESFLKRQRMDEFGDALPVGFLDPLSPGDPSLPVFMAQPVSQRRMIEAAPVRTCSRQFWKAGDFEEENLRASSSAGIDRLRIHPKFLHSNATSHKWALGAFAELLDNSLDESCNGATYVNIDALENKKDGCRMLLIEDNGGGMDANSLRQCMSLGYSIKGNLTNTIGQYGNGFKTSTMRLGADVIVFTRCHGKDRKSPTQSIGMLSYTFLRSTGKEDIVVPMLHYEKEGITWNRLMPRSTDWERNLDTILQWSPYSSEADLLLQGTRIIIYNLWEDDEGQLELDFDFNQHDIQIRGVNRDAKKIEMAKLYPNSRHFLTYKHSLRSYASILYLRIPHAFRITLRGKDVEHHDLVNDLMLKEKITYRPQTVDGVLKASNMFAVVTIGFVNDAKFHIDIQGFNVYHKNRLIKRFLFFFKPFWRVWNAAGSGGRGIVGVLEADFVQPAHDKQGFEHTNVLSRLETKLNQIQKTFWNSNRHKIGYASQHTKKLEFSASSPEFPQPSSLKHGPMSHGTENGTSTPRFGNKLSSPQSRLYESSPLSRDDSDPERVGHLPRQPRIGRVDHKAVSSQNASQKDGSRSPQSVPQGDGNVNEHHEADHISASNDTCNRLKPGPSKYDDSRIKHLEEENRELINRINELEKSMLSQLQFERHRGTLLEAQLQDLAGKQDQADKEQEALVDIFTEERTRRDKEEQLLRNRLKDSSATIQELLKKTASNTSKAKLEP
ncbi:hypothetical protein AAC387_Pa01g2077 [Persea americana]